MTIDLDALEKLAIDVKAWYVADHPFDSPFDTNPDDLFRAMTTPDAILELIRMARASCEEKT